MQDTDLNELRMINLFSKVTEGKFSSKGLVIDVDNIRYIESIFNGKDFQEYKFIIVWGNSLTSSYACQKSKYEILKMLKETNPDATVYQINFAGSEDIGVDFAHPLFLGIRGSKEKWKLEKKNLSKLMTEAPEKIR
jgi:hypothetical protein